MDLWVLVGASPLGWAPVAGWVCEEVSSEVSSVYERFARKFSWVDTCRREENEAGIGQRERLGCGAISAEA